MFLEIALLAALQIPSTWPRLPDGYSYVNDDSGIAIKSSYGHVMIGPNILSLGITKKWIVGCIYHHWPEGKADDKRYVIIGLEGSGGSVDTINRGNWKHFVKKFPSLGKVEMNKIVSEECP